MAETVQTKVKQEIQNADGKPYVLENAKVRRIDDNSTGSIMAVELIYRPKFKGDGDGPIINTAALIDVEKYHEELPDDLKAKLQEIEAKLPKPEEFDPKSGDVWAAHREEMVAVTEAIEAAGYETFLEHYLDNYPKVRALTGLFKLVFQGGVSEISYYHLLSQAVGYDNLFGFYPLVDDHLIEHDTLIDLDKTIANHVLEVTGAEDIRKVLEDAAEAVAMVKALTE